MHRFELPLRVNYLRHVRSRALNALRRACPTALNGPHRNVLPSLLLIGGMKCGTTVLHRLLAQHPLIAGGKVKESGFFSSRYDRGLEWYRSLFPVPKGFNGLALDASPFDLFHPLAPTRVAKVLPEAKVVCLLRNPVDRAISHFTHERHYGRVGRDLDAIIDWDLTHATEELEKLASGRVAVSYPLVHRGIVSRSRYPDQIRRWQTAIDADRLLFLKSETMYSDPLQTARRVFRFLGLDPSVPLHPVPVNSLEKPSIAPATRARLWDLLAPDARETRELLGNEFTWREKPD